MQPAPSSQHRKSSLATLQKTLDSILEESEHDSSTHKKSSISSSLTSSFEDEEDFDSDCSVNSAQDETHELLLEFEASTQTFIATEQERILKGILEMPPAASTAVAASAATALQVEKKNELLEGVNETLATLQAEISSLDKFISIKDRFIDQAAASSAELAKAKHDLQNQFSRHADEIALIKQKLELARTSLRFADNDHDESKVQPLKCQLENSKLKINDMEAKITGFLNMVTLEQDFNQLSLEDNIRQRIDELRTYKDALVKEKQIVDHLLDHLFKPDPRICQLCREHPSQIRHNLAQPGTDPMKIQQRKYELDVLMETLDTAIDMKNSALLGQHWQLPSVDNPSEQDFLMGQLEALSTIEAKSLLGILLHRTMELKMNGHQKDMELRQKDHQDRDTVKRWKKLTNTCAKISQENAELNIRLKEMTEKADKYKKFYILQQKSSQAAEVLQASHEEPNKGIKYEGNKLIVDQASTKLRSRRTTRR